MERLGDEKRETSLPPAAEVSHRKAKDEEKETNPFIVSMDLTPSRGETLPFDFPESKLPLASPGTALESRLENECQRQPNRFELWSPRFQAEPTAEGRLMGD